MELRQGYKETEIGVIPEDWDVQGLLSVVKIASGQVDPKVAPFDEMPLIAPDHIESGTGRLLQIRTARQQNAISGKYVFSAGDVVYSKIRPYLQKAILADFDGLCSADMYPLRPESGVSGRYILDNLLAHRFTKYAESVSVRSGMPKINRTELADFRIPLPKPPEQKVIAEALSDVDASIAALSRLIAKKRDLRQGAMQRLLTGQTRLPGFGSNVREYKVSDVGMIPDDWDAASLGSLGETLIGLTYSPAQVASSGALVLRSSNIQNDALSFEDNVYVTSVVPGKLMVRSGDVLICVRNGSRALIGKSAFLDERVKGMTFGAFMAVFRSEIGGFVSYLFQSSILKRQIDEHLGATINQITNRSLNSFKIPLPRDPLERTAIPSALQDMDAEIAALDARLDKTRALKQAMTQALLTGRVRLPVRGDAALQTREVTRG